MTRLLLDTHVMLWLAGVTDRLPATVRERLAETDELLLSTVSIWEIAIKSSLDRGLVLPEVVDVWIPTRLALLGVAEVPFVAAHAVRAGRLPLLHRDPFDRALVAVARAEGVPIVSADPQIARYDVEVVWAGPAAG